MTKLYLTADRIGEATGGGLVTRHEQLAMKQTWFDTQTISRKELLEVEHPTELQEPWKWDKLAHFMFGSKVRLAHLYSGSFPESVRKLKDYGAKVCYTIAAHDVEISRNEHEKLSLPFPYPHLTEPKRWQRYIQCYRDADIIVCPGQVPADTVRRYGPEFENKDIRIVPHGCDVPTEVVAPPSQFIVGYAGSLGADKGLRYLLEAWKKLNYKDGSLLVLAGRDTKEPWALDFFKKFGGGSVATKGWVDNLSDFYNEISLYLQPSATEGFGLEVLESMAHGRAVLCSQNAGACSLLPESWQFPACDSDALADRIDYIKKNGDLAKIGRVNHQLAKDYSWDKIRQQYVAIWQELLLEGCLKAT